MSRFKRAPLRYSMLIAGLAALCSGSLSRHRRARRTQKAEQTKPAEHPKPRRATQRGDQPNEATAEQVAESVIIIAGNGAGRAMLTQIRKNGLERGRETRTSADDAPKRLGTSCDLFMATSRTKTKCASTAKPLRLEYSLVYGEGRLFGIIMALPLRHARTPHLTLSRSRAHSIDALLQLQRARIEVTSAGKDKQQELDLYVIDLVDKAGRKPRYFISAKSFAFFRLNTRDATWFCYSG